MRKKLEEHHIAGKHNSLITVTTCFFDCHLHITNRQMAWDPRWENANNSENLKTSFILQGIQEFFVEKHLKTGIRDYRLLADSLNSHIKHYRETV